MRTVLPLLALLPLLGGCPAEIGISGHDLSRLFPDNTEWYWRYNNVGTTDVMYWYKPAGGATFRIWLGAEQAILDDIEAGAQNWTAELSFEEQGDGWYWTGWGSDDEELGSNAFDFDGVPFALRNSYNNETRTVTLGSDTWRTTSIRQAQTLELNGQVIDDYWTIDVSTEAGDQPLEGTWDMATGLILRYDLPAFAPETGEPWRHLHNDDWANVLGSR